MNALLLTLLIAAAPAADPLPRTAEIEWVHGTLDDVLSDAQGLTMVYCWRDGSDYCAKLYSETLGDERVAAALGGRPVLSANFGEDVGAALIQRYRVATLPAILFVDSAGVAQDVILGFIDPQGLVEEVGRIDRGEGTLADLEARAAAVEGDEDETFEERMALAGKLLDLGQVERHDALVEGIRAADPKSETVVGARAWLWKLEADLVPACACVETCSCPEPDPAGFDLSALYRHAERAQQPEARFEAFTELAMLEAQREQSSKLIANLRAADRNVPAEQAMAWRLDVARWMLELPGEPSSKQQALAVEFAEAAFAEAEGLEPEGIEAQCAALHVETYEQLLAVYRGTLASALQQAGEQEQAEALMERCVGQCPEGGYAEQLRKMRSSS